MIPLESDYSSIWTAAEANEQLKDFRFTGPGWYFTKTDTVLVWPLDRNDPETFWHQKYKADEHFRFYIWNFPSASLGMALAARAPTRQDDLPLTMKPKKSMPKPKPRPDDDSTRRKTEDRDP
jgi:hypothetical protein